jgi:UDP-N-acetylmuramate dehydrogenase
MEIFRDFSLQPYNTFGINARAGYFARFSSAGELEELLSREPFSRQPLILGGGSNILLTRDAPAVLKNAVKGLEVIARDTRHAYVRAGGGELWHGLVEYSIARGLAGIENLSLIPGLAGAAPMQNIGAYGVEVRDVFHELEAFDLREQRVVTFSAADCAFGYRESVFKKKYRGRFVILSITLRLNLTPTYNISYGAIEKELQEMGVTELSIAAISRAVIRIRSAKLPDPARIGNAGSFFKNPEVDAEKYTALKKEFPGLVAYPVAGGYKLAAGWMIEQCGWKGRREGEAGVHDRQALVLVNYGGATGADIYRLSGKVAASVLDRFGVALEREVNIF